MGQASSTVELFMYATILWVMISGCFFADLYEAHVKWHKKRKDKFSTWRHVFSREIGKMGVISGAKVTGKTTCLVWCWCLDVNAKNNVDQGDMMVR